MGCGIAGFVGFSDKELLMRMLEVQRHRGPDDTGYFLDANVGLGTDRLSIIDLVKGNQPIHNEDGSVWVTFNGEIYNYVELRKELEQKGHRFYTDGDTETVVHGYEEWGFECLGRLRGMFAFAVWDGNKRILFAGRDRFGKKPFYYTIKGGIFLFASELKGLLQFEELKREINYQALDYFFTYFYIPSPFTIFNGVYKLPPGHFLVYDGSRLTVKQYWDMSFNPTEQDEELVVDRLYENLSESVRIRLRSDVPLGCFLSGGIDSSTVAAIMRRVSSEPIKTVTIGFEGENEHIRFGRLVSGFLKTEHTEYFVSPRSAEILPKLVWHFDEPFADSSLIPTYYVSEMTRKSVKVALTGDGGDEMFMGYPFLRDQPIFGVYRALPVPLRKLGLNLLVRWPGDGEFKKMAGHALEKEYGQQDFGERYILRMVVHTPQTLTKLYSGEMNASRSPSDTLSFLRGHVGRYLMQDSLNAVNYATFNGYLSEMILVKVDRMSMVVSLEARCPLLDHVLADYVGTIPSNLKYRGHVTKYVFKQMALDKGLLPKEVIYRKKVGFGPPVDRWMGSEWGDLSSQALDKAAGTGLFNREYLSKLLRDRSLNSAKIFGLTVFALWYSMYVERDGKSPVSLDKLL